MFWKGRTAIDMGLVVPGVVGEARRINQKTSVVTATIPTAIASQMNFLPFEFPTARLAE